MLSAPTPFSEIRTMRRFLPLLVIAFSLTAVASGPAADEKKKDEPTEKNSSPALVVGKNLPGAFHPFNVTGPRKGNFHCLVSASGLNGGVMILCRDLEITEPLKDLLQRLDNAIEKNPNVRMSAFCVFLPADLPQFSPEQFPDLQERKKQGDVVDDKREALAAKVDEIARSAMLKHVVLALTHEKDVKDYALDKDAVFTIVIYHKYEIQAVWSFEKSQLTPEKVDEVLNLIATKLGARRK